jgi:hypothetical protein
MAAVPAHAHALARLPLRNASAHRIHYADDFVTGDAGVLQSRPVAFLYQRIAVANAAGLNFDSHLAGSWLGNFTFYNFKRSTGPDNLGNTHFWHNQIELNFAY